MCGDHVRLDQGAASEVLSTHRARVLALLSCMFGTVGGLLDTCGKALATNVTLKVELAVAVLTLRVLLELGPVPEAFAALLAVQLGLSRVLHGNVATDVEESIVLAAIWAILSLVLSKIMYSYNLSRFVQKVATFLRADECPILIWHNVTSTDAALGQLLPV